MDLTIFEALFGISIANTMAFAGLGMVVVAFCKEAFGLQGKWIYAVSGGLQLIINFIVYLPHWDAVFVGAVLSFLGASGAWAGMKQLATKANPNK